MSKEKNVRMIATLHKIAEMVGQQQNHADYDYKIGLGMTLQHDRCLEEIQAITDGLFRVVIMGTFTSGKSTLVNALLGSNILPESALPSTAILTFIQYGNDEDDVEIYFKDTVNADGSVTAGRVEHISKEEFVATYQYTNADNKEFVQTGSVTRFKDVAYSIVRSPLPLIADGVNIVDSPGLEDKTVATQLALDIAAKAQAIVYMCGERGFAESDREYFQEHFKGNPGNIFFVLNKMDHIASDAQREQAMERVRNDVKICFTNLEGCIDEGLMAKRVFGLSALLALDARRGLTFDKDLQKDVAIDADKAEMKLQHSRFLPFEHALREFLTTDERCTAQYRKVFRTMFDTYNDAVAKVREDRDIYKRNIQLSTEKQEACQRIIEEIENGLSITEKSFDNCTLKLQNTLGILIRNAVDSINSTWEVDLDALHEKICFDMKDYFSLALSNINVFKSKESREEYIKKLLQPFSEIIADHIADKIDRFMDNNRMVLEHAIHEAELSVNTHFNNVSGLFSQLGNVLTESPQINKGGGQDWLQAIISCCVGDASAIVKNCTGSRTAWMEFIRKAVFNGVWQWLVIQMVTGGWGVVICALIEWIQIKNGKNEMIDRMLTESKNAALKEIHAKLDDSLYEINTNIAIKVNELKEARCGDARQRLSDKRNSLAEIVRNMHDSTFNAEQEKIRTNHIIDALAQEIRSCYEDVFGEVYTEALAKVE